MINQDDPHRMGRLFSIAFGVDAVVLILTTASMADGSQSQIVDRLFAISLLAAVPLLFLMLNESLRKRNAEA